MAFEAILTIEDKTFRVLSFDFFSARDSDRSGRPTSVLYGGKLNLVVEHSPDCVLLHDWAYKNHEVKNGKVTFMKRDNLQKQTEISFSEGYVISIATSFQSVGDQPMTESIVISAGKFEYESQGKTAAYDLEWPESS